MAANPEAFAFASPEQQPWTDSSTIASNYPSESETQQRPRPHGPIDDEDMQETLTDAEGLFAWVDVYLALERLRSLDSGWNSYGGRSISRQAINAALRFAEAFVRTGILPSPQVVPTPKGGVQFEWYRNGIELEIEFKSLLSTELFYEDTRSGEIEELELQHDFRGLTSYFRRLSA